MNKLFVCFIIITIFSLTSVNGAEDINWYSIDDGFALSDETGKPLLLFLYTDAIPDKDESILSNESVINIINNKYIPVKIDYVNQRDIITKINEKNIPVWFQGGAINIVNNNEFLGYYSSEVIIISNDQTKLLEFLNEHSQVVTIEEFDLGKLSIKEYKDFIDNLEKQKMVKIEAILDGATIRELSGPSNDQYSLILDDGTATLRVIYNGGLGNINTGDQVNVKIIIDGRLSESGPTPKIVTISKSSQNIPKYNDGISTKPTPGFGLITGIVVLFFIWKKMLLK